MKVINVFCDASIDIDRKIACGGCFITLQEVYPIGTKTNGYYTIQEFNLNEVRDYYSKMYIQHNATNNSAEILAIWAGIVEIIKLRKDYPNAIYRLFADSKISLYGLRDWMKNWIRRCDNGVLVSTSGTPVANQQYFIDIYNMIIDFGIKVELYHQRGHAGESVSVATSRSHFIKANKVPPEALGLTIEEINRCNHIIDNSTRDSLKDYILNGIIRPDTELEGVRPLVFYPRVNMLDTYIQNINKTSIISRHDFKNGYNQ